MMRPTAEEITAFFDTLDADCTQRTPDSEWTFSNGDALFICAHSARRVAAHFGGRVVGFDREANPGAVIAEDHDGHDFAVIGERLMVDYWANRVTGLIDRGVFDLTDTEDRSEIERLYGPTKNWCILRVPKPPPEAYE
jgi:hypothetical protein